MNKAVGTCIGESLGELIDVDVAGDGDGWGQCLRIWVRIELLKAIGDMLSMLQGNHTRLLSSMRNCLCSTFSVGEFCMKSRDAQSNQCESKLWRGIYSASTLLNER
jgi:hypothetical protein